MEVLIVEDNEINQKILKVICEKNNLNYTVVQNGMEAIQAFSIKDYDLIFMDCQMPVLDGYEATRLIREVEKQRASTDQHTRCCIIAVTANSMLGDREKCLLAGMDDFISKPFKSQQIVEIIRKWKPH